MNTLNGMNSGPNGYLIANERHVCDVWIAYHRHPVKPEQYNSATLGVDPLSEAEATTINQANEDRVLELVFTTTDGVPASIIAGDLELIHPTAENDTQVLIKPLRDDAWHWFPWTEAANHQRPAR